MTLDKLKSYGHISREAWQLRALLYELAERMTSPGSPQISAAPKAHSTGSRLEDAFIRYTDTEEKYRLKLAELFALQLEIEEAVSGLDPLERMVIRGRYIQLMTWEDLSDYIGYSYTQTFRFHKTAIEKMKKNMRSE